MMADLYDMGRVFIVPGLSHDITRHACIHPQNHHFFFDTGYVSFEFFHSVTLYCIVHEKGGNNYRKECGA